ncbi:MAG TPA: radical SAM protein [Clostridiales bacterium]|nr:radical SAM protein [Clostridiales bacterium]HQH64178.1 radical SAM protein [Clostridiales bacterium]HQK74507.1 radical SAM protein [Clostridiales bacterium]
MKVLLVNAATDNVTQKPVIPLGLLSIATCLAEHGHTVRIFDRTVERGGRGKYLRSFAPDIVGISAITFGSFPDAMKLTARWRKAGVPVVWGGQLPSLVPEIVLKDSGADFVVIGDGEFALLELLDALASGNDVKDIAGLAYMSGGRVEFTRVRGQAPLDDFPVIDWSYVDPRKYFVRNVSCARTLHVYSSKGCPGQCTYCYSPCFCKGTWRARPLEHVVAELRALSETAGIDGVYFADDLISPNRGYMERFCAALKNSGLGLLWGCNLRADTCTRDELQMMYDAGCRWILFGIESGTPERQKMIKKNLNLAKTADTFRWCAEIGIQTTATFIVGYPGETVEEMRASIGYVLGLKPDISACGMFGLIPKSELFETLVSEGKVEPPQSFADWNRLKWLDKLGKNLSQVPDIDLKVVVNRFFYGVITSKSGKDGADSRLWAKRLIGQALSFLRMGNARAVKLFFLSAAQFLQIVFYALCYPKILKKYGLR